MVSAETPHSSFARLASDALVARLWSTHLRAPWRLPVHTWREPVLIAAVEFNTGIARSEREHTCVTCPVALLSQIARRRKDTENVA